MSLLELKNISVHIPTGKKLARAVDGLSLRIEAGESLGLVGESGCGKTLTALAVLGLTPQKAQVRGEAFFEGAGDLFSLGQQERRKVRGRLIAAVFQDPTTFLNPVFTVENQVVEVLRLHQGMKKIRARERTRELLARVRIQDVERCALSYPWQLSGGMRQRVMIAMALACGPKLLIADEPTTALDLSVQARVLDVLMEGVRNSGSALWLITHDLGVVAGTCDRVAVMYAGRIVEEGRVGEVFDHPAHPYTQALLETIRSLEEGRIHSSIPGQAPAATDHPPGCPFHPRCREALPQCSAGPVPRRTLSKTHTTVCHLADS